MRGPQRRRTTTRRAGRTEAGSTPRTLTRGPRKGHPSGSTGKRNAAAAHGTGVALGMAGGPSHLGRVHLYGAVDLPGGERGSACGARPAAGGGSARRQGEDRGVARAVEVAGAASSAAGSPGGCTTPTRRARRRRRGARSRRPRPGRRPGRRPRAARTVAATVCQTPAVGVTVREPSGASVGTGRARGRPPAPTAAEPRRDPRPERAAAGARGTGGARNPRPPAWARGRGRQPRGSACGGVDAGRRRARRPAAWCSSSRNPARGSSAPGRAARSSIATRSSSASACVARNGGAAAREQVVEVAAHPAPGHRSISWASWAARRRARCCRTFALAG